jgi:PAS domain S-box-containing protein
MSTATENYSDDALNDLSDYFYGAPIGLKATGPDGMITRTNLAELKLFGYDEDEYVGHHLAEFHSDPDAARGMLDRLASGERVAEYETTLLRRDGTPQKVLIYANARIDNGELRGVRCFTFPHPDDLRPDIAEAGALTDLSVQSRGISLSDAERRELYSELQDFFDNGPVNLHIVGGDGLIKHANRSELASMGYAPEAYLGQHIAKFHAEQRVIDGMLEDLVGGTPLVNFSATLFHKDGSKIPVMIYSNSRMKDGSFINTRCFTVSVPKSRTAQPGVHEFGWPRNEDFGFTLDGRTPSGGKPNPMTVALKYIASRKRPEESLGFLAAVSRALGRSTPLAQLLGEVAGLAVPFLADFCGVVLGDAPFVHATGTALRGKTDQLLSRAIDGTGGAFDLQALGVGSALELPISIRGTAAGALVLMRADHPTRRKLGPADRALGEELARRIAFAIEIDRLKAD